MTSSHPRRSAFRLALDGWPKRTIFGNLTSFIRRKYPSHTNPSPIALKSGIEPRFSCNLLYETQSVRKISRQFLWKTSSKSPSAFQSAHASEPYLTTVITVISNILTLVCRLIFLFFQAFLTVRKKKKKKNTLSLGYSTFNIFTAFTVFTNNTTKVSEGCQGMGLDALHHVWLLKRN